MATAVDEKSGECTVGNILIGRCLATLHQRLRETGSFACNLWMLVANEYVEQFFTEESILQELKRNPSRGT